MDAAGRCGGGLLSEGARRAAKSAYLKAMSAYLTAPPEQEAEARVHLEQMWLVWNEQMEAAQ